MRLHENLNLAIIRLFKWSKISNIKRLKKIKRISRYAESQNIIIFIINLKFIRIMTLVAVKNKKLIYILRARFYMLIKIFYLIYIQLIIYLTVIINFNFLIIKNCRVFVLEEKIIFYFNYNKRRDYLILRIYFLNNKNLFLITKLS